MRHKFARERDPGPRAPGHALAFSPRSLVRSCGSGSRVSWSLPSGRASRGPGGSPGTRDGNVSPGAIYPGTRPITAFARAE